MSGHSGKYVFSPYAFMGMRIPDGLPDAGTYRGKAVRFALDEALFDEGGSLPYLALGAVEPATLEVVGEMAYGSVVDVDADGFSLSLYIDCDAGEIGDVVRFAVDEGTRVFKGDPPYQTAIGRANELYNPGDGCEVLYDPDTMTVLLMRESNG